MSEGKTEASIYQQAEDGKTELSLMHFAITNPQWQPPRETTHFISQLKERVHREATGSSSDTHPLSLSEFEVWGKMLKHLHQQSRKHIYLTFLVTVSSVAVSHSSQPRSLIANLLGGPSTLASIHFCRDSSLTSHTAAGIIDGASALRSLSPLTNSAQLRGNLNVAHRPAGHNLAMGKTMTGSG